MYKLIASDLDETMLSTDRTVSKRNIEAIKKARELGVKFVCATGRGYRTVDNTLKEIGLYQEKDEYVISFNGGAITENSTNELIHFEGISFELASNLYKRGLNYDVCIHIYTEDTVYAYNFSEEEKEYLNGRFDVIQLYDDNIDFLKDTPIVKALYMNTNYEYLKGIEEDLKDITQDVDVSYSANRYIEFNHKGVNKGEGLLKLANILGIKQEETIAIGDNFNDLSMIKAAGLGVGVANTIEGMKDQCDYITEADHNHDAIAEVIEKFILNIE